MLGRCLHEAALVERVVHEVRHGVHLEGGLVDDDLQVHLRLPVRQVLPLGHARRRRRVRGLAQRCLPRRRLAREEVVQPDGLQALGVGLLVTTAEAPHSEGTLRRAAPRLLRTLSGLGC